MQSANKHRRWCTKVPPYTRNLMRCLHRDQRPCSNAYLQQGQQLVLASASSTTCPGLGGALPGGSCGLPPCCPLFPSCSSGLLGLLPLGVLFSPGCFGGPPPPGGSPPGGPPPPDDPCCPSPGISSSDGLSCVGPAPCRVSIASG